MNHGTGGKIGAKIIDVYPQCTEFVYYSTIKLRHHNSFANTFVDADA
jgi:hypothetical protein